MAETDDKIVVLAVDDEPSNNALIRRTLRGRSEYTFVAAESAERALTILQTQHIDVMIVDQSMPGMTGVALATKAAQLLPGISTIMVTAYPELTAVRSARKSGMVRHILAKPWKTADLLRAVSQAVTLRKMRMAVVGLSSTEGKI